MPLVFVRDGAVELIGSSFNVAPGGIMATARHVLDEGNARRARHPGSYLAVIWTEAEPNDAAKRLHYGRYLQVLETRSSDAHDVALIRVEQGVRNGRRVKLPLATLSTAVPPIGARILGLGYTALDLDPGEVWEDMASAGQKFKATYGSVNQAYPDGRDRSMLPFPVVETSARFDGAMSGGPVFDGATGSVFGVICSSIDTPIRPYEYTSYLALVICALGIPAGVDGHSGKSLYDLMQSGVIRKCDNLDQVEVQTSPDGHYVIGFRT